MFGNLGPTEMVFILVVLLLVFGAKRLPEIGSSLGRGIREFKRSMTDIQHEINRPDPPATLAQAAPPQAVAAPAPATPVQAAPASEGGEAPKA